MPKLEVRLKALQKLKDAKIKTWVSLAPIVPAIRLTNFKWLFEKLKDAGVSAISLGLLRFIGYETSRRMFEERTGINSRKALENSVEIIAEVRDLAEQAGLDTSCSSLEWVQKQQESEKRAEYSRMEYFFKD